MNMNNTHLSSAKARTNLVRNTNLACRASGCSQRRRGFSTFCRQCLPNAKRLGHPNARAIWPSEYRDPENKVNDLFVCNPDHAGLVYVTQALGSWMQEAVAAADLAPKNRPHPSVEEVARLVRHGVTASALLVRLCAVFAFLRSNPNVLPNDDARAFAISHAVIKLAPRARRQSRTRKSQWVVAPKSGAVAHLGRHLSGWLVAFLETVAQAVEQREQQRASVQQSLREPFGVPAAAILAEEARA